MSNFILEKLGCNLSNNWIIGCSILTFGIMSHAYLHNISNIHIIHIKHKYMLELHQIKNNIDLYDKIQIENKLISYYWNHYHCVFIIGITGSSMIVFRKTLFTHF